MKKLFFPVFFLPLLASCGGSTVDRLTLAGNLAGTWSEGMPTKTGVINLTMHSDGSISGQWQKPFSASFDTVDVATSTFNGLHMKLNLPTLGYFEGNVIKVGSHVSGTLFQDQLDVKIPYEVSLDLSP